MKKYSRRKPTKKRHRGVSFRGHRPCKKAWLVLGVKSMILGLILLGGRQMTVKMEIDMTIVSYVVVVDNCNDYYDVSLKEY